MLTKVLYLHSLCHRGGKEFAGYENNSAMGIEVRIHTQDNVIDAGYFVGQQASHPTAKGCLI
jgi:hypothetical protein